MPKILKILIFLLVLLITLIFALPTSGFIYKSGDVEEANIWGQGYLISERHIVSAPVLAKITAYTAREEETDSSPTTTASGQQVREDIVACPRKYPFGTKFKIEDKVYECQDRMAQKNDEKFDIYFNNLNEALSFGVKKLPVEVVK